MLKKPVYNFWYPSVLFISGNPEGIGYVFRVKHNIEALNFLGWKTNWCTPHDPELMSLLRLNDLVVLFRIKWDTTIESICNYCTHHYIPLVYDIDDLLFEPDLMIPEVFAYLDILPAEKRSDWVKNSILIRESLMHCNAALLSTEPLAEAASGYCKSVFVLPNTLNLTMEKLAEETLNQEKPSASDNRVRVGFASGSPTHHRDFAVAAPALTRILKSNKDLVFVSVGDLDISQYPGFSSFSDQIEIRPKVPLDSIFGEFARFDISLAPLEAGNPFCEAKSELRYVFAAAVAVPSVVSPTNPLKSTIVNNQTGLLASNQFDWENAINYLINNPEIRKSMGEMARLHIHKHFGWERKLALTANIFSSLIESCKKTNHNKIKNICLHVGLHKTGTTIIQENLLLNRKILCEKGYLYPEFRIGTTPISNHSIPFYSLFCSEPESYHMNIRMGQTTPDSITKLHRDYYLQLTDQINSFQGENLIISGEDISRFSLNELLKLKEFLVSITNPGVKFIVIVVLRHPVDWITSLTQQLVKMGNTNLIDMDKIVLNAQSLLNILINAPFVFGEENVKFFRYEDLVTNGKGFIVAFLQQVQMRADVINALTINSAKLNSSLSYEGVMLFKNLFRKYPLFINKQLNSLYSGIKLNAFHSIPGVKFYLTDAENQRIWDLFVGKINSCCLNHGLDTYEFRNRQVKNNAEKWDQPAIDYLTVLLPTLKNELVAEIINGVLTELDKYRNQFTWSKKIRIFALVMFYSVFLETHPFRHKIFYFIHRIGLWQFLVLAVMYKIRQKKLQQHIISLKINK